MNAYDEIKNLGLQNKANSYDKALSAIITALTIEDDDKLNRFVKQLQTSIKSNDDATCNAVIKNAAVYIRRMAEKRKEEAAILTNALKDLA